MFMSIPAHLGYGVLAGLVFGESAGLPIPGETALVGAGLLAASGQLSLPLVIGVTASAAILGDNLGFWFGRRAVDAPCSQRGDRFVATVSICWRAARRFLDVMAPKRSSCPGGSLASGPWRQSWLGPPGCP